MRLLDGARGYVQSDGYVAYHTAAASLRLTHARRRFFEAIKALPKSEQGKNAVAHEIVRRIDVLYAINREIK